MAAGRFAIRGGDFGSLAMTAMILSAPRPAVGPPARAVATPGNRLTIRQERSRVSRPS